ncbi:MAG: antibiotic biosynthesis monooxygenase [Amycolatopsis sp.]|jgi:heme-degrading monooxygenase HmoA/acyl carrier protein|uniref:phosphopantetheine-binding protein n=1 Tax=Amycolatopsis sp. TaxID=37632 RepID=UPI00261A8E76|nr:phosphopantetheine-binding protein [Amycolatopsis sp.]MCU1686726.1 antibiotic biosynthesis monooxygenase [Amycolatopsis sp.]
MDKVTEASLVEVMNAISGDNLETSETASPLDRSFDDMGFDSLARQELIGRLERTHGVRCGPDLVLTDASTPRELLVAVSEQEHGAGVTTTSLRWRIMLELDIVPELAAKFEKVWSEVGTSVSADPANRGQWLLRDAERQHLYYVVSDWTTKEDFERFERSERHLQHRRLLHPYRRAGSMKSMNVVAYLPGDGH